jgi:hypothetical protein
LNKTYFKGLISGLIIGILITTLAVSYAVSTIKEAYINPSVKISYNGQQIATEVITVVKQGDTNGSNYVPVRALSEAMDKTVSWDGATSTISINDTMVLTKETEVETVDKITETPDGIRIFKSDFWDGKQYIEAARVQEKAKKNGYELKHFPERYTLRKGDEILIFDVPTIRKYTIDYIEVDYYIETIMPLIK